MSQGAIIAALSRPKGDRTTRRALRALLDAGEVQHGPNGYTAGVAKPPEPLGVSEVLPPPAEGLPLVLEGMPERVVVRDGWDVP